LPDARTCFDRDDVRVPGSDPDDGGDPNEDHGMRR
jgi:hypothetical protein